MSTMTETLNNEALFYPSEETENREEYVPKASGEYLGHIVNAETVVREFIRDNRTVKATIFNFKFKVAPENEKQRFTITTNGSQREVDGSHYVDWTILADGVFRYLEPTGKDNFVSYSEGNKKYLMFCHAIGIEIKTEERTMNDRKVNVQLLPEITTDDLNGRPVTAVVGRGEDWVDNKGKKNPSYRVKFVKAWEDGKRLATTTTNDLPF